MAVHLIVYCQPNATLFFSVEEHSCRPSPSSNSEKPVLLPRFGRVHFLPPFQITDPDASTLTTTLKCRSSPLLAVLIPNLSPVKPNPNSATPANSKPSNPRHLPQQTNLEELHENPTAALPNLRPCRQLRHRRCPHLPHLPRINNLSKSPTTPSPRLLRGDSRQPTTLVVADPRHPTANSSTKTAASRRQAPIIDLLLNSHPPSSSSPSHTKQRLPLTVLP